MVKIITVIFLFFCLITQKASAYTVEYIVENYIAKITDKIADFVFFPIDIYGAKIPIIILWILIAGIFFTVYFRVIAIWGFKHSLNLISQAKKSFFL